MVLCSDWWDGKKEDAGGRAHLSCLLPSGLGSLGFKTSIVDVLEKVVPVGSFHPWC